jgi:demethylmenaquinone methyltransferase / 2-methoxy-6-polyprenyl-1,4-benzoquinol methylase
MSHLTGDERARFVRATFARIAPRYDLLNRLMAWGQDGSWRREAILKLGVQPGQTILDSGTGTGDIAHQIKRQHPQTSVVGCDFTLEMVRGARRRPGGEQIKWVIGDAQHLPFTRDSFNGVICGYLLRNVTDLDLTLAEDFRVLRCGGWNISLDTTPPQKNLLKPFILVYLNFIVPLLGRIFAGETEAYSYLIRSTEKFLTAEDLSDRFEKMGFTAAGFKRRMMGTMAIHWGQKG